MLQHYSILLLAAFLFHIVLVTVATWQLVLQFGRFEQNFLAALPTTITIVAARRIPACRGRLGSTLAKDLLLLLFLVLHYMSKFSAVLQQFCLISFFFFCGP